MNQAFFTRVLVTEDGVVGWEYQEPFKSLMKIHEQVVAALSPASQALAEDEPGSAWSEFETDALGGGGGFGPTTFGL